MKEKKIYFVLPTFIFGGFLAVCALGLLAVVVDICNGKI
jgi:hypothetical protein